MLFSTHPHEVYATPIVHEVVCQLQFPPILTINNTEPAEFQEQIRHLFPQYSRRLIKQSQGTDQPLYYHTFISEDNRWKMAICKDFINMSTMAYHGWQEFANQLDKPLAEFIRIYQPAYFQRVGLRYMNLVNREKLGMEETPWSELVSAPYQSILGLDDVKADDVASVTTNYDLKLSSSARAVVKSGMVQLQQKTPQGMVKSKPQFLFDMDLSMYTRTPCTLSAPALETLHAHSTPLFQGFVTDTLRQAMQPVD